MRWFVEGDIKGCFDNIDHSVLVGQRQYNHGRTAGRPGSGFAAWKHGGSVEECLIEYLDAKGAYLYGGAVNAAVQQKEST